MENERGECILAPGLQPVIEPCKPGQEFYYLPTGYRKIPLSTCIGEHEVYKSERKECSAWQQPNQEGAREGILAIMFAWVKNLVLVILILAGTGVLFFYLYQNKNVQRYVLFGRVD